MEDDIQVEFSVFIIIYQFGSHPEVAHAALRTGVEINITLDAAVFPVVLSFKVRAVAVTEYLDSKFVAALFQKLRNVEVRRQTAVFGISGKLTVHPYVVGGFHSLKVEEDIHTFPTAGNREFADVCSHRIVIGWHMRGIGREWITGIRINRCIEALQLPASGNLYFAPLPDVVSRFVEVFGTKFVVL